MPATQDDLAHVIDLFKGLNLPVTDDGTLIETKGKDLEGFYLKKKGSPDPQQRAEADTWFKNRTRLLQDRPAVLEVVRSAFVGFADVALGAALAAGVKQLTPELASQLERLALDQCKCDPPLAHGLMAEYLKKNSLTVNAPLTKPRRLIAKCPFCLGRHEATKPPYYCPTFNNEEIPEAFMRDYDRVPPLWVVAIGFSGHGKAGYLADLTAALENIQRVWPATTQQYLDQYTGKAVQPLRRQAGAGGPASVTGKGVSRPLLLSLCDVPDAGSRCLVLFDTPGELFEALKGPDDVERIHALMDVKNIWLVVSLKALKENPARRVSDLLAAYVNGAQRLKWPLARRNLIVVYTDADTTWSELPGRIQGYLRSDPFQTIAAAGQPVADLSNFSLGSYVEKMRAISSELSDYTRQRIPGGDALISLARKHDLELVFTVSSASGAEADARPGRARASVRCRVMDPFLWALYLDRSVVRRSIKLVLDAAKESDPVYALALGDLVEKLVDLGEVTPYYLGAITRIAAPGQPLPGRKPTRPHPRLIGPLLDQAAPNSKVIAIVTGPIRDLEDYFNTNWRERLRLIVVGARPHQEWWPNTVLLQPKGDVKAAYEELAGWLEAESGR